ncbi:polysaccharide biosynthesis protein [Bacillus vallismortis]|uniref:putative polysaccharide biosynthesis protein n=1 Tax=Bacillus vallismortis TaxID=72361 RepID=UPI00227DFFE7|nr:polysaccharide biosynthesis protein [Bacillus vallismortis]MCY7894991.1 polysaccharide biosynthesis protein [Bacillus vallismortis]
MDDSIGVKRHWIWQGAFVLILAGVISKILSAVYRVPFQNIVGDVGFYIYQQVYPFLGIAVMLSTSGFPVIISKLMNDYSEKSHRNILKISALFLSLIGILLFLCLYMGAVPIARFMGDSHLAVLIQVTAFAFLLFPFVALLRGAFQGRQDMFPSALSQMTEQFLRVAVLLGLSYWLVKQGASLYTAGAAAASGSLAGSFVGLIILAFLWFKVKRDNQTNSHNENVITTKELIKKLLLYSVTICISSLLLLLIQLVDALNLYALLSGGEASEEAKRLKGIYDRGQPLLQLGSVFAVSIATSLVPYISKAVKNKELKIMKEKVTSSLKLCLVLGTGASAGLICILEPVNIMLFQNSEGTAALQVFSSSILFASLAVTAAAVLHGAGYTVFPAIAVGAGLAVKWVLNTLLVPRYGIEGASLATAASFAAVAGLNLYQLRQKEWLGKLKGILIPMIGSALLMAAVLFIYLRLWAFLLPAAGRGASAIESFSAVAIGGAVFIYCMMKLGIFTDEELNSVPFGSKLSKIIRRREQNGG